MSDVRIARVDLAAKRSIIRKISLHLALDLTELRLRLRESKFGVGAVEQHQELTLLH